MVLFFKKSGQLKIVFFWTFLWERALLFLHLRTCKSCIWVWILKKFNKIYKIIQIELFHCIEEWKKCVESIQKTKMNSKYFHNSKLCIASYEFQWKRNRSLFYFFSIHWRFITYYENSIHEISVEKEYKDKFMNTSFHYKIQVFYWTFSTRRTSCLFHFKTFTLQIIEYGIQLHYSYVYMKLFFEEIFSFF